jgi:hypothetical protein
VDPPLAPAPQTVVTEDNAITTTLQDRHQFQELLKTQLARAQSTMKLHADSKCSERHFQVGEQVRLKLQPYIQSSVALIPCPKISFKYFLPYIVLEKLESAAYKLQLPVSSQIHPIFHVSQLKSFTPSYVLVFSELPSVPLLDLHDLVPEAILER